jgi:HemY protein
MRRVLTVLVACVVVLGVAWLLAGLPGRVTAEFGATTVEMATPVAAFGLLLLFFVLYVVFRLLGGMLRLPGIAARWDAERDRQRGDLAVSRALVALAAGDKGDARREAGRARRWLGDTPQTLLLAAEAGRLAGRDDEAEDMFRRLVDRPGAAFLGYRGLMRQALTRQDWTEATALARQAEAAHPGAEWLRLQRARLAIRAGHWTEALDLADSDAARAALATGAAGAEKDPAQAMKLARQAWKADASLAPAALAYATRLRADGREARAQAVIRHTWSLAPHPDLAVFALAPVTDRLARATAAQRLAEANPEHAESRLLLARTALDAGLTGEARHQATLARGAGVNQRRLWLLLAEIEEAEHGGTDAGALAARAALRQAATADADPEWRCAECHTAHVVWYPACTTCGAPGSLRWVSGRTRVPQLQPLPPAAALSPETDRHDA